MLQAHEKAVQVGDFEYAALSLTGYCVSSFISAMDLNRLAEVMVDAVRKIQRFQHEIYLHAVEMHQQAVMNLMGSGAKNPGILKGEYFDEDEQIELYRESNDRTSSFHLYSLKACLFYLFGEYSRALEVARYARPYVEAALGGMQIPVWCFYEALTALALYNRVPGSERRRLMKTARANRRKLGKWARHAPMNYLHKYWLVEAERFRVIGRHPKAVEYYEKAVAAAKESRFIQEEGLTHELFGQFLFDSGDTTRAEEQLGEARSCYSKWGAHAKVNDLVRRYPYVFGHSDEFEDMHEGRLEPEVTKSREIIVSPDLEALAKGLHAIAGEVNLEKLIQKLMQIVMEVGGAEKGFLLLKADKELLVEAEVGSGLDDITVLQSVPLNRVEAISIPVVNYVEHTMDLITLDDCSKNDLFKSNSRSPYDRPKSLLCAPLIHQGHLVGMLYLENRLTKGAFLADREAVLRFLCSQAAIFIENARLYEQLEDHSRHLEQRVRERTKEYELAVHTLKKEVQEKQEAQESLQRALTTTAMLRKEAEAASAAKSNFLANMSHELRTPLNAIMGFSEVLEDQLNGRLNDKQLTYVRHIFNSGHHLLQLINNVLDLAKVEAGRMDLRVSAQDFNLLLYNCTLMVKEKAINHGLDLQLQISDELKTAQILADEVKLKQILVNLLSNAVKFTPDGGRIELEASRVKGRIAICVKDTGVGIRPEDRDRIFEAFEQVDSSRTRRQEGTGLGLALSKRLVELHGGRIWVESEGLDKGSRFVFTIPFIPIDSDKEKTKEALGLGVNSGIPARLVRDEARPVVLVVEDNEANMQLATSLLETGGYDPLQAYTAEEGIDMAKSERPDLILMDISLPNMDGLTAKTCVLKDAPATGKIPVVALTAHVMKGDESKALEAGCDAYLTKPIDSEMFFKTLQQLIPNRNSGPV